MGTAAALTGTMDARVREKIYEIFNRKQCSTTVVRELLEDYVSSTLGKTNRAMKRFYPTRPAIRNVLNSIKARKRWSRVDLENTAHYLQTWPKEGGHMYFRRCVVEEVDRSGTDSENCCTDDERTSRDFLLVYQSKEMKHLFQQYATLGVLVDSTYCVCKCVLPLTFVVVKTNSGYQPFCFIITQFETRSCLSEALYIL